MANDVALRRIATAAALACVAVVAVTIAAVAFPSLRSRLGLVPSTPPSYRVGERIDVPARFYEEAPHTLFVFVRSNCAACQSAKPALERIADTFRQAMTPVLVISTGARATDGIGYAAEIGVERTSVLALDVSTLRLRVVPTIVLVNRAGEVLYAAEGVPTDQQAEQLLRLVNANTPRG